MLPTLNYKTSKDYGNTPSEVSGESWPLYSLTKIGRLYLRHTANLENVRMIDSRALVLSWTVCACVAKLLRKKIALWDAAVGLTLVSAVGRYCGDYRNEFQFSSQNACSSFIHLLGWEIT